MNSTTTTHSNREMNDILSETKIQGQIVKNKVAVFVLLGVLVAAIIGFGLFKTFADKSKAEYNTKIHVFETTVLKTYTTNPAAPNAAKTLESGLQALHTEMGNYLGLLPIIIKSSDALLNNAHLTEARSLLAIGEKVASDDFAEYFILSRQAVVYEDSGEDKLAIETLEKMTNHSVKIFVGKAYLDLGRLYLKAGNKEKARANFTQVVEKAKDDAEFVKLAQLYIAKL